ncbi:MAG: hypothetical protein IJT28_05035 [Bacteroidaceae bacterium]|nr:hypothetical protein [Bacteroidaceae bacterium]
MKIIYFHGFASSGATGTAESLRRMLPEVQVISPDIPVDPSEALPYLRRLCEQEQPDLIIGTSMGAMYAQQMFGFRKILVNPSFNMSTLSKVFRTGEHKFLNGRKDNAKTFKITKEIIQKQNMMERQQFKGITPFDRENTYGLFGIHDTTVNCYDLFKKYYTNAQRFDGEHHLNEKALRTAVVPLAKTILGL